MDDGKVNAKSPAMLTALHDAFDRAAAEGSIAVLSGRDNLFSAGFDLKVFSGAAPAEGTAMVRLGAQLVLKLLG